MLACLDGRARGLCVASGLKQVTRWWEVGSFLSEPMKHFRLVECVEGAGCDRSADRLSLGHNGIKLITSHCDRV